MSRTSVRTVICILPATVGLLVALPALAQDTEIRSALFRVEPKPTLALTSSVENLRDSALLAWRIDVGQGGYTEENYVGSWFPYGRGRGPIMPHETRTITRVGRGGSANTEARLVAAVFADGYSQGSERELKALFSAIEERASELTYWLDTLGKAPDGSEKDIAEYLLAKIAERARQSPADVLQIRSNLRGRLPQEARPDGWIKSTVEDYQRDLSAALRAARLTPVMATAGAPPSLNVRTVPSENTDYAGHIENLRDASIEAWIIETGRSPDGRSRTTQGSDTCIGDPALDDGRYLGGRIRPHQVREVSLQISPQATPQQVRLTMVLFEDLSFEGSAEDRDAILKARERQADEAAYWSRVFQETAALPADRVKAYLQAKRGERAGQNAVAGRGSTTHEVDQAIAALERSPQTFSAWLEGQIATLDSQRTRLMRHLKR